MHDSKTGPAPKGEEVDHAHRYENGQIDSATLQSLTGFSSGPPKIRLHFFPAEKNQPAVRNYDRDQKEQCRQYSGREPHTTGDVACRHCQKCHHSKEANSCEQSTKDQRRNTRPAPCAQQTDSSARAPNCKANKPDHIAVIETSHFAVSTRLEVEHQQTERSESVANDGQPTDRPDPPRAIDSGYHHSIALHA